jgi:hypothetical protein
MLDGQNIAVVTWSTEGLLCRLRGEEPVSVLDETSHAGSRGADEAGYLVLL